MTTCARLKASGRVTNSMECEGEAMRTAIHDVTTEFLAAEIDWTLPSARCCAQFPERTRAMRDGLYVAVYVNESEHDVWDDNEGREKVVVEARSSTLKYGKFEGGVVDRYKEQFEHLRRHPPGEPSQTWIFRELVRFVIVLDLTPVPLPSCSCARVFEPFWNAQIEHWLREHHLLSKQGKRIESRRLLGVPKREALLPLLIRLQARIEAAAQALA
jgi:hypothetical protein